MWLFYHKNFSPSLTTILTHRDLKVTNVTVQKTLKNLQGRSLRLDIDAVDSENR